MNRFVLLLSFLGISLLFVLGLVAPNNPAVWLASTSHAFAAVRLILMIAFGLLLVITPPRNPLLREAVGLLAVITAVWTLTSTYNNDMKFLDTLSLLEFSIAAGIAVLERDAKELLETITPDRTVSKSKQITV